MGAVQDAKDDRGWLIALVVAVIVVVIALQFYLQVGEGL